MILSLSSQERPALLVALLLRITSEGAGMVMPLILAEGYNAVVDGLVREEEASVTQDTLARVFILALSLHVAGNVFGFLAGCATGVAGERVVSRLRRRLYDHLLTQEMGFFDSYKSGDLVSRLGSDTQLVQQATTQALNECLVGLIKAIDEASAGRSVIVVAHRLSTVRDADQIAVMSQGVIADCGTHAELIERCDMYQTLVQRQMSGAPAAAPE